VNGIKGLKNSEFSYTVHSDEFYKPVFFKKNWATQKCGNKYGKYLDISLHIYLFCVGHRLKHNLEGIYRY
jgi:hypothetical protein